MKIGVLALQGNFKEHIDSLKKSGVETVEVRLPEELEGINGLVLPGGESTTIAKLLIKYELWDKLIEKHKQGMGFFGTCAGAILISKKITNTDQTSLGLIDIEIARNDYGRQIDSFETELEIKSIGNFKSIFIRAPVIESVGDGVETLAEFEGKPVLVQQGKVMACTFHPELTDREDVHKYFVKILED